MARQLPILIALLCVLFGPILLRPKGAGIPRADERTVVIITPHNESIRSEFGHAFEEWSWAKHGERLHVDWRIPGGTSEIGRYIDSEYLSSFQNYWEGTLHRPWSKLVEGSFSNRKVVLGPDSAKDSPEQQARRAFLDSKVGCKLDLFFGGGAYDFQQAASKGLLVDCGFLKGHPQLFGDQPGQIPRVVSGEPYWDPQGRWVGTVISSFGICYNTEALGRLGIAEPPKRWADLAEPRYFRTVALANPTQSSSVNRTFEMLIQQQIQQEIAGRALGPQEEQAAVSAGWVRAMRLLMKIGANARYFTDASAKIALDVEMGEAAAGMTIDFFGRFQSEAVRRPDGTSRLQYGNAEGGTSYGVDPIGLFRGAPNPEPAKEFIAFIMSPEGQKLWNWKIGEPGGPRHFALRRLPVLPALYAPEYRPLRSDPDVNPYELARTFVYHDQWTAPLFRQIAFIFRVMCIDSHEDLQEAWSALQAAQFPIEAMRTFEDVGVIDYAAANGKIREALSGDKIHEVRLAKELADHFRDQYARAATLARARR
ncbi:MAG: extracellular solute-binding protein [Chthoniobacter sp.]